MSRPKNRFLLLLLSLFLLCACGQQTEAVTTPLVETAGAQMEITQPQTETLLSTEVKESPAQTLAESSTPAVEESTTQTSGESDPALTTDFSNLEYTSEKISFREKKSDFEDFSVSRQMQTFSVNGRSYCFDTNIPEADCRERIRFTEELLIKAGITREFRICFYNVVKMKHTYVENGSLYCRMGHMSDIDYLTAVLLAAYGEFANYGMAYGYAGLLLGEAIPEASYPEDWDYYDLNLLCFSPDFCDEEKLNNNKAIALDFASAYVAQQGHEVYQDLLEKSGQLETAETARAALSEHYKNCGVEPKLSPLLYAMGGTTYSHILRCEYATFYTERDWADKDWDHVYDISGWRDLHYEIIRGGTSYKAYKNLFEHLRLEMKQYQLFFSPYPNKNHLPVFLVNHAGMTNAGYYNPHQHQIYLSTLPRLAHEYIHSLTYSKLKTSTRWIIEGIASYYETRFSEYSNALYVCIVEAGKDCGAEMKNVSKRFLDSLGRRFDPVNDSADYSSLKTYFYGYSVYDEPYSAGSAFIDYLIKCFGERAVLDYFLVHHDLSRLTDKSMDDLMLEWKSYLEERFKDYEKAGNQS